MARTDSDSGHLWSSHCSWESLTPLVILTHVFGNVWCPGSGPRAFPPFHVAGGTPVSPGKTAKELREGLVTFPHHPCSTGKPGAVNFLRTHCGRVIVTWKKADLQQTLSEPGLVPIGNQGGGNEEWEWPGLFLLACTCGERLDLVYLYFPTEQEHSTWPAPLLSHHSTLLLRLLIILIRVLAIIKDVFYGNQNGASCQDFLKHQLT